LKFSLSPVFLVSLARTLGCLKVVELFKAIIFVLVCVVFVLIGFLKCYLSPVSFFVLAWLFEIVRSVIVL
jgi:hypothetical protein